jgi:F-type H+-transporting ATPase subunit gamma
MSQLIQMRQRIQAIETIKKVTHAMQLISMSLHTRLQKQITSRDSYRYNLLNMLQITSQAKNSTANQITSSTIINNKQLLIIIGAQKGLCGNFDTEILRFVDHNLSLNIASTASSTNSTTNTNINPNLITHEIICIGSKKITQELRKRNLNIIQEYPGLKINSLAVISREIFNFIVKNQANYQTITSFSNKSETFFINQPVKTEIYPIATDITKQKSNKVAEPKKNNISENNTLANHLVINSSDYIWDSSPLELYNYLLERYLNYTIQSVLFDSLVAEQAARFRSMDTANRNASDLLEISYRDYNKLRQYKITKELIELSAAF